MTTFLGAFDKYLPKYTIILDPFDKCFRQVFEHFFLCKTV